eukprot:gene17001-19441_t
MQRRDPMTKGRLSVPVPTPLPTRALIASSTIVVNIDRLVANVLGQCAAAHPTEHQCGCRHADERGRCGDGCAPSPNATRQETEPARLPIGLSKSTPMISVATTGNQGSPVSHWSPGLDFSWNAGVRPAPASKRREQDLAAAANFRR